MLFSIYSPREAKQGHTQKRINMLNFFSFPWLEQQGSWLNLSITLLGLSLIILFVKWSQPSSKRSRLPPSPPRLPIIGNLHQVGLHPHRSLRSLAKIHGPIMFLDLGLGSIPVLVISSAETAREIMKTHDLVFADRPRSTISEKLLYNRRDIAAAPYGEYWRQLKGISVLHLLNSKRVQSFKNVREEETACMIDRIKESSSSSAPVNLSELLANLTNDVICRVALGRKHIATGGRKFKDLMGDFVGLLGFNIGNYLPWLAWVNHVNGVNAKTDRVAKEIDNFLNKVVEEHMCCEDHGENHNDFVDVLLWIQKNNMAGFPMDRTSIKALILDVFSAGTDSTYTVLEWAMSELLRSPKIMKKLQNEVREIGKNKSEITTDDLQNMHYLKAVIKETLRFHPPLPLLVPRISTQDVQINGFDIAVGTQVIINAWAIGRDPAYWDRAEEFWPDRFLNTSIDIKGHDFQLLPFGAGRRACPGIHFAITVEELALANLLYKFDWALPSGLREEDLDMTESVGLTTHRKVPLHAVATPCSF